MPTGPCAARPWRIRATPAASSPSAASTQPYRTVAEDAQSGKPCSAANDIAALARSRTVLTSPRTWWDQQLRYKAWLVVWAWPSSSAAASAARLRATAWSGYPCQSRIEDVKLRHATRVLDAHRNTGEARSAVP